MNSELLCENVESEIILGKVYQTIFPSPGTATGSCKAIQMQFAL